MQKRVSATESVCQRLAADIFHLTFQPGEKLTEAELSARYGVSRNTLREAVAYLISDGLLEKKTNTGIYVRALTDKDVQDIFHLRLLLEVEAVRMLLEQETLSPELFVLAERAACIDPETEWAAQLEADISFHAMLVQSAGSVRLFRLYERLISEIRLCLYQSHAFVSPKKERRGHHVQILQAISRKQSRQALDLLTEHILSAVTNYANAIGRLSEQNRI